MVDMGQYDSSLRQKPLAQQSTMCWTRALALAAQRMGYLHYVNVPDEDDEALRFLARGLMNGEVK